jgi:hypothetical protein
MALKKCKECGEEISKKAKECPKCGSPQKKRTSFLTWFITIFLALFLYAYFASEKNKYEKDVEISAQTPSQEEYKKQGKKFVYRDASLEKYPDLETLIIKGKMSQFLSNSTGIIFTKENELFGYIEDQVMVSFNSKPDLVPDDIVEIYGRFRGVKEVETVLGEAKKIPQIKVDYFKVIEKKQ